jgi:signal transduction histidine kinase
MMTRGAAVAGVTDLHAPENAGERQFGKLLEVYLGVRTQQGTPLLFETYQPYGLIDSTSRRLWLRTLPVLLGGLGLLYLVSVPLVWHLATQLRASQEQRERLLLAALAASDRERQRVAADLHDGVVQDLSGTSWALSAEAGRAAGRGETDSAGVLESLAGDLRRSARELRSVVVSITPPGLRRQALPESLTDLLTPLELRGVVVHLDAPARLDLDERTRELLLRAAQEALRNVARHAEARSVTVSVSQAADSVELSVTDDGRGFSPGAGAGRPDSVGLDLITALVEEQGGTLAVASAPGHGTTVTLVVPARHRAPVPA